MIIPPPITDIPRFLSLSFPSYRYIPKYFPHPFRSEKGHHHMEIIKNQVKEEERFEVFWLHGCDLFAYRYYWEAHEFWEEVWKQAEKPRKYEIQAAIKMSASILKKHMNHIGPSQKLWNHSFDILRNTSHPYLSFWCAKVQKFYVSNDWSELEFGVHERKEYLSLISNLKMKQ